MAATLFAAAPAPHARPPLPVPETLAAARAGSAGAPAGSRYVPVPIRAGPEYQPPARWPLAGGAAFGGLRGALVSGHRMHLELFARGRVIVVPGGIGISGGRTTRYGSVTDALWHAPIWTLERGGVISFAPGGRLGDLFAVWGQPLSPGQLLGFDGPVRVYLNGSRWHGDPATLGLHDRDQVVLEADGYVPPHPSFVFEPSP